MDGRTDEQPNTVRALTTNLVVSGTGEEVVTLLMYQLIRAISKVTDFRHQYKKVLTYKINRKFTSNVFYEKNSKMALSPGDPSSYSRPDLACVTHIHLNLNVNFEKKVLKGHVILDIEKRGVTDEVILDNHDLMIVAVLNAIDGSNLKYSTEGKVAFGSKLSIRLPETSISSNSDIMRYKIEIQYETSPNATALQWLTPKQTAGGQHPYLFSQCQVIEIENGAVVRI